MEKKLIQSIFHEMVRSVEASNGGKKIRDEGTFRGIFHDAVDQAKLNLNEVTFDDVLGIDKPVLESLADSKIDQHIYRG